MKYNKIVMLTILYITFRAEFPRLVYLSNIKMNGNMEWSTFVICVFLEDSW